MNDKKLNPIVGAVLCVIIGIPFIIGGYYSSQHAKQSISWPITKGLIVKSEVRRETSGETSKRTYSANIEYEYNVNNQDYKGSRITYKGVRAYQSSGPAKSFANKHPMGKTLNVSYDPKKPSRSVLYPGSDKLPWIMFFGLAFSLWGLGSIVVIRFKRNKNSN
jgi:hypothetical protein